MGAIGLALVYSIAEVPNFAHGEFLMLGAYLAFLVNKPAEVPVFDLLATGPRNLSTLGLVVIFLLTVVSVLGVIYLFGGRASLEGDWWPVQVAPRVGIAGNLVLAGLLGVVVVVSTPSIWGGMLLATLVMAAFTPQLDRVIFQNFREKGADLATMLIVTLGLSFVLRYTTQAYFGGRNRVFVVPDAGTLFDVTVPLSAAQLFNFYVTDARVIFEWFNTAAAGNEPGLVAVVGWSWLFLIGMLLVSLVAGVLSARWRSNRGGRAATFGPWVVGVVVGVIVFVVLSVLTASQRTVPASSVYSTQIRLSVMRALVIGIALGMMTVLHVLLQETKLGIAMRASSDNLDLAKVTGINTDRVMMTTWIVAGAYAAIGGVMLGILFSQIYPRMGFNILLPMFAGVILGGVGSVYGAMIGSFLVGLSMELGIVLLNLEVIYRIPIAFVVLFIVLLVKPEGLRGGG
jgi:neutral amino acid transport system permease protein